MSANIRALIEEKNKDKAHNKKIMLKDINHDLIIALLALPVYGKEVRDEEILSIIINNGIDDMKDYKAIIKESYEKNYKGKKLKKDSNGIERDSEGYIVLTPKF